jgi:hypothetical protein
MFLAFRCAEKWASKLQSLGRRRDPVAAPLNLPSLDRGSGLRVESGGLTIQEGSWVRFSV